MKKVLLIFLILVFSTLLLADITRVNTEADLPYWQENILSGDPNLLDDYWRVFIKSLQDIQDEIIHAVNLGVDVSDTDVRYFGTKDDAGNYANGDWRIIKVSSDDFEIQKLISTTWTQMSKWSETGGFEYLTTIADSDSGFAVASGTITGAVDITASGTITGGTLTDGTFTTTAGVTSTGSLALTTDLEVQYGGTGASTFTDGGILLGSGTGAITVLGVATNGQIPIGDGTTDPVLATLTAVANETDVTNAAGSITIGIVDPLIVAKGGSGAATFTDGGVLLGSGTSAFTAMGVLADSEFIVGDGTTDPVAESGNTARTSLGLGTGDSPTFTAQTLSAGPFDLSGKMTVGTFASPIDVTATREYGTELHYSGNNYNVTALRARGRVKTTDTTASAQGALLQAANEDGINAGVLNGALIEAIGKSDTTASTISMMRGCLVNTEWNAKETITDLRTLHVRTHSRDAATEGYVSGTGYGIYIENEAVGGNGQAYDAGIYFKDTNLSGGNSAFTYGIDFSGGTFASEEIKLKSNGLIGTDKVTHRPDTDSTTYYQILAADGSVILNADSTNERVGIGTDAPIDLSTVSGAAELDGSDPVTMSIRNTTDGTWTVDSAWASLKFRSDDGSGAWSSGTGETRAEIAILAQNTAGSASTMSFRVGSSGASLREIMRFNGEDRRFGINTQAPIAQLHVVGVNSAGLVRTFVIDGDGESDDYALQVRTNANASNATDTNTRFIVMGSGFVGLSEIDPETLLELTHATPNITTHNSTQELDGRESRWIAKGERAGGEESTLGWIESGHDSGVDDEEGYWDFFINDGDDGESPTKRARLDTVGLEFVNSTIIYDVNNVSADLTTFETYGLHIIDSSGAGVTGTLAAGTKTGQSVKFVCKVAGNDIDITVSNHVTSDPEVIRLDTAKEWVELVWDGTDWVETDGNGQSYP